MAIDFFEKEVEKLSVNSTVLMETGLSVTLGPGMQPSWRSVRRECWLVDQRCIDKKHIGDMTREFCHIRNVLNQSLILRNHNKKGGPMPTQKTRTDRHQRLTCFRKAKRKSASTAATSTDRMAERR